MKDHSPFKIHRILTVLETKSKFACLMQVILLVVEHRVLSQDQRINGGGVMRLTVPSRKKDNL